MHVTVKGKQLDVGDALRTHVNETLTNLVGKYFSNPIDALVVLSKDAGLYTADIQVHVGRGILLQSNAQASEPYPAFDAAAERVAKRLRRYKRRLRDHNARLATAAEVALPARKYIIEAPADEMDGAETDVGLDGGAESADGAPMIVAEMKTDIELLTVSEAVMRMDLADIPALMFRNRAHGGLNMVYRRPDGNVGWVDPADSGAAKEAGA
ncbi:ribosome hibernation-promoting factor, HPF/YfiA family [Indioceanicola profundi]|uniref:ribosome hibernation-promoting factor, HPF/YfiA family n=1 Tax=Indioceanicola profundi TaxID=2220096 RepID=UPI000E6ACB5B|nr:ribosome-associated translation inhibitor RaiA [Indioceanicola profundi]